MDNLANNTSEAESPLLDDVVQVAVDYHGHSATRSKSGGSRCGNCGEVCILWNKFEFNKLPDGAENVNPWSGAASLLPLLGAFVTDSYIGRYCSIVISSLLYILGLGLLTFSAAFPFSNSVDCQNALYGGSCSSPLQIVIFFFALYLVAAAQGGHKPFAQAFGADRFDVHDPKEQKERSSFFNWWYFGMSGGSLVTLSVLNYIQDNLQ